MPSKPVHRDRVRIPPQWWHARLAWVGAIGLWVGVFIVGEWALFSPRGIKLNPVFGLVLFVLAINVSPAWEFFVRRAWAKRIIERDGRLCPRCAYLLVGVPEHDARVTCPECSHVTADTSQLFERWRAAMKWFFWSDHQRLRTHKDKPDRPPR